MLGRGTNSVVTALFGVAWVWIQALSGLALYAVPYEELLSHVGAGVEFVILSSAVFALLFFTMALICERYRLFAMFACVATFGHLFLIDLNLSKDHFLVLMATILIIAYAVMLPCIIIRWKQANQEQKH
jgi:hypothetical protein